MLLLAAAIIAAQPTGHSTGSRAGSLTAVATATVRIVSGARVTATSHPADALAETVQLPGADGQTSLATLIEFQ